jgi:hypothetical protein
MGLGVKPRKQGEQPGEVENGTFGSGFAGL